jgi:hypothetical protein
MYICIYICISPAHDLPPLHLSVWKTSSFRSLSFITPTPSTFFPPLALALSVIINDQLLMYPSVWWQKRQFFRTRTLPVPTRLATSYPSVSHTPLTQGKFWTIMVKDRSLLKDETVRWKHHNPFYPAYFGCVIRGWEGLLIYECRCEKRLRTEAEGSTRLA